MAAAAAVAATPGCPVAEMKILQISVQKKKKKRFTHPFAGSDMVATAVIRFVRVF